MFPPKAKQNLQSVLKQSLPPLLKFLPEQSKTDTNKQIKKRASL